MGHQQDTEPVDARAAFAASLSRLRSRVSDVSDEVLARRASTLPLPSGRRITVNARRLGEWLSGRSVPRAFDPVLAVVQAMNGGSAGLAVEHWRQLWQAAQTQRIATATERRARDRHAGDRRTGDHQADERQSRTGRTDEHHAGERQTSDRRNDGHRAERQTSDRQAGDRRTENRRTDEHQAQARQANDRQAGEHRAGERQTSERQAGERPADRALRIGSEAESGPIAQLSSKRSDETYGGGRTALVVGRPPSDAAALCTRTPLAAAIDAALGDDTVRQVVLSGPGGAGKSQLAAAAFHRRRGRGGVRAWVPAASRQAVITAYARAWRVIASDARDQRPPDAYGHDEQAQADLLVAWMRTSGESWLVVLDDVDDPTDLDGLWPIGESGRSIVTTRRRDAALIRPAARVIDVGMFAPEESQAYLRDRLSADPAAAAATDQELAGLAAALGHLPLALSQAAAYLIDSGTTVAAYRRLIEDRRERVDDLFPSSSPADGHAHTVASIWQISAARAATLARPGTAQRLLELIAVLAPEGVPTAVLTAPAARHWIGGTEREALPALRALHRLNLVTHDGPTVAMHALVQRAVLDSVPQPARSELAIAAADALDQVWEERPDGPSLQAALFDSVEALRRAAGDELWPGGMHPVLRRVGRHLAGLGRHAAAGAAAGQLREQARARLGDEHRDVLFLRGQVAAAAGNLGDWGSALTELTRLRLDAERVLGPHDPDTLEARLREALARLETGDAAAAGRDLRGLVTDASPVLGRMHPVTRSAAAELVLCDGLVGDVAAARDLGAVLVAELTEHLGSRHPDTAAATMTLARWIGEAGDPDEAVRVTAGALAALVAMAGRLHHETLVARHNLAYWRALAGQHELAVAEFAAGAADADQVLGPRHPTTLTFRANLAYWRGLSGDPTPTQPGNTPHNPTDDRVTEAAPGQAGEEDGRPRKAAPHAPRAGEAAADQAGDAAHEQAGGMADESAGEADRRVDRAARGAAELGALQPLLIEVLGAAHPRRLRVRRQRAELLHRAGDVAAATAELAETLAQMRAVHGDDDARTQEVAALLAAWGGS